MKILLKILHLNKDNKKMKNSEEFLRPSVASVYNQADSKVYLETNINH